MRIKGRCGLVVMLLVVPLILMFSSIVARAADAVIELHPVSKEIRINSVFELDVTGLQSSDLKFALNGNELFGNVTTMPDNTRHVIIDFSNKEFDANSSDPVPDSKKNYDTLKNILGKKSGGFFSRNGSVAVIDAATGKQLAKIDGIRIVRINAVKFIFFTVLASLVIYIFLRLARESDLLRDTGKLIDQNKRKTYSLARTQLAIWNVVIIISYFFIWLVLDDMSNILNKDTLVLLGISSATGFVAAAVDSSKTTEQKNGLQSLRKQQFGLEQEISVLQASLNDPSTQQDEIKKNLTNKQVELDQIKIQIIALEETVNPQPTRGFTADLLNDDDGISVHRFQIFIWTLCLLMIFIYKVFAELAISEFGDSLLLLMGVSGGTYVGFKVPKQEG